MNENLCPVCQEEDCQSEACAMVYSDNFFADELLPNYDDFDDFFLLDEEN